MSKRIVLAYSGDLETAVAIPALADAHDAEIVTLTLDLGAGRDLEEIRDRALTAGAARAHVIDAREEFVRDFVLPSLQAGALHDGRDPMAAALARPLVGEKAGRSRGDRAGARRHRSMPHGRNPVGAPGRRLRAHQIVRAAPDTPAYVEIVFERGVPAAVNGVPMGDDRTDRKPVHHCRASWCRADRVRRLVHRGAGGGRAARGPCGARIGVLPADVLRAKRERAPTTRPDRGRPLVEPGPRGDGCPECRACRPRSPASVRIKLFKGTLHTCRGRRARSCGGPAVMTLWSGRFDGAPDPAAFDFGVSFGFDRALFEDDVTGSIAWAEALGAAGVHRRGRCGGNRGGAESDPRRREARSRVRVRP